MCVSRQTVEAKDGTARSCRCECFWITGYVEEFFEERWAARDLTWKFAEDRRTLFDRQLYQHHLIFLPPACKHALANFPCVLDPLRLKGSDHITLSMHVKHGYRSTTHLPGLAARYGKDIPGAKAHAQAIEGNDQAIGELEPFGKCRVSGHVRSFHSIVPLSCQVPGQRPSVRADAASRRVQAATAG